MQRVLVERPSVEEIRNRELAGTNGKQPLGEFRMVIARLIGQLRADVAIISEAIAQ